MAVISIKATIYRNGPLEYVGFTKIQNAIITNLMEYPYRLSRIAMAPKYKTVMLSSPISPDVGVQSEQWQ